MGTSVTVVIQHILGMGDSIGPITLHRFALLFNHLKIITHRVLITEV